jgi:hypothetical protein
VHSNDTLASVQPNGNARAEMSDRVHFAAMSMFGVLADSENNQIGLYGQR